MASKGTATEGEDAGRGARAAGSGGPAAARRAEHERPRPSGRDGGDDAATDAAADPSAKTSSSSSSSSSSAVTQADSTETATDLSSPHSVRQKEKVSEAMSSAATPSTPAADKKGAAAGPSSKTPPVPASFHIQVKADSRPADRGGQKVSKIPVMWSPEKVKGAALGLLSKSSSSQPAGQTPDGTGDPSDLSSSPKKENLCEDGPPPSKMARLGPEAEAAARLCSDAAVAALSAAMGLLAKTPPAPPPPAPTPAAAKQRTQRISYAKQIKLMKDADPSPAIMRRYRPDRNKTASSSSSSSAVMWRKRTTAETHASPAIMRRKTFRSQVKKEPNDPKRLTAARAGQKGQKAYDRRADTRQKVIMTRCAPKFKSPPKFKVTGAVFCEGRVMGLLATRPIAGASTSSAAVKQQATLTLPPPPPLQKAAGGPRDPKVVMMLPGDKLKGGSTSPSAKTSDPGAPPAIMRRNRPDRQKQKSPVKCPVAPSSSSPHLTMQDRMETTSVLTSKKADEGAAGSLVTVRWSPEKAKGAAVNPSSQTPPVTPSSSSSPGKPADQKADKRATDRGGQSVSKIPVTWSAEKVKGATMGLLAKAADPSSSSSSSQTVQKADQRPADSAPWVPYPLTGSTFPVTWSPEKVQGVMSLLAKRSESEDALAVMRLRQRIRPQRKVLKRGPLQQIAHHVKLGHYHKLPADIAAVPSLFEAVVGEVMKRVKEESARVTRSAFGSVLRRTNLQALKEFRWEELVEEWRSSAPTFLKLLQSAASVSLDGGGGGGGATAAAAAARKRPPKRPPNANTAEAKTKKRVAAMAGAMLLHARSRHMRAPMLRNSLLLHAGDKKRCFVRLRTQGLCVSYKQTLQKIKEMGGAYDRQALQWKEDAIEGETRGGEGEEAEAAPGAGEAAENAEEPQDGGENPCSSSSPAGQQCENGAPEPEPVLLVP